MAELSASKCTYYLWIAVPQKYVHYNIMMYIMYHVLVLVHVCIFVDLSPFFRAQLVSLCIGAYFTMHHHGIVRKQYVNINMNCELREHAEAAAGALTEQKIKTFFIIPSYHSQFVSIEYAEHG